MRSVQAPQMLFQRGDRVALSPQCARCRGHVAAGWSEVRIFDHSFQAGRFSYDVVDGMGRSIEVCEECICSGLLGHQGTEGGRCSFCGQRLFVRDEASDLARTG